MLRPCVERGLFLGGTVIRGVAAVYNRFNYQGKAACPVLRPNCAPKKRHQINVLHGLPRRWRGRRSSHRVLLAF
jgi:hypothetical protein